MPKTQINYPQPTNVYSGSSDGPSFVEQVCEPVVNVNWRNSTEGAGHVQLSLDVPLKYMQTAMDAPNGQLTVGSTLLFSPVLGRSEINTLIRALRKARDSAYGADA